MIVLVMHGAPPTDFPRNELGEFFALFGQQKRHGSHDSAGSKRYADLEQKIKNWPRTASNDPFFTASDDLASELAKATGRRVIVGYNEFCAPDVPEALEKAKVAGADQIIVVTPMMTRGGEHAETEIPSLVKEFQQKNPGIKTVYAWPFDIKEIAGFMKRQIDLYI